MMKRKIFCLALAALLVFALVSCDDGWAGIMGAMGTNMMGKDESQVGTAVESVTVSDENKTTNKTAEEETKINDNVTLEKGATTISYKNSDGAATKLFTVGKSKSGKQVIAIEKFALELDESVKANVTDIKAILPPQDLTTVMDTLESSGKDALLSSLKEKITDETTKEAAEGSAALVQALLETASSSMGKDDEIGKELGDIVKNLEKEELTMGDVVVLQALTNVLTSAGSDVLDAVDKSSKGEKVDTTEVVNDVYDDAMNAITIIDAVAETTSAFKDMNLASILEKVMQ